MRRRRFAIVRLAALCATVLLVSLSCARQGAGRTSPSADALFAAHDSVLAHADAFSDTIRIHYARGLKVDYRDDGIHVVISNPDPSAPYSAPEEIVITRPLRRFICTTALQLGNFEVLGLEECIVGMNSLKNLFSPTMQQQMRDGRTMRIGKEGNFDVETILATQPDYIFVSASKHGGFEAIRACGIPFITHHGYKETDPLGQAEWIKLVGLLTGEPRRANAVFADIERKYLTLKEEVSRSTGQQVNRSTSQQVNRSTGQQVNRSTGKRLPTVASGRQLRDGWYAVGGRSYMAQLFRDAGAAYVMADNEDSGGRTLDFEAAYARSVHADFWQIDGSFEGDFTLATLAAEDPRYATLDAYRNRRVLFCNLAHTPYRELAGVQPHLLLADFVKAFHPELLPHYVPQYYKLME